MVKSNYMLKAFDGSEQPGRKIGRLRECDALASSGATTTGGSVAMCVGTGA